MNLFADVYLGTPLNPSWNVSPQLSSSRFKLEHIGLECSKKKKKIVPSHNGKRRIVELTSFVVAVISWWKRWYFYFLSWDICLSVNNTLSRLFHTVAELSFLLLHVCMTLPTLLPFGHGTDTPTSRIREGLATVPASLPVPPLPSAQRGVPLGMARWTSLWLMGMVSARYCAPQGLCLPFLSPNAVLAVMPTSSSMPASQLKLLVGTSITSRHLPSFLMSNCGSAHCLRRYQSGLSQSLPLLSAAIWKESFCVYVLVL